jgi:hypothetical protein
MICESCGRDPEKGHKATEPRPTLEQLEAMSFDGQAEATDGCTVEPDGRRQHGHSSWLIVLGFM